MANAFSYAGFLDEMDSLGRFVCINEVNYEWNGNPIQPEAMQYSMLMARKVANDVTGWLAERVESVGGLPKLHKRIVYNDYTIWCMQNDFIPQAPQAFWLKIKRCRTDLVDKKVRVGNGFQYVLSLIHI